MLFDSSMRHVPDPQLRLSTSRVGQFREQCQVYVEKERTSSHTPCESENRICGGLIGRVRDVSNGSSEDSDTSAWEHITWD